MGFSKDSILSHYSPLAMAHLVLFESIGKFKSLNMFQPLLPKIVDVVQESKSPKIGLPTTLTFK